ncbi:MAG TPA: long-chain fatty acid--CoA ligase [Candidatus Dormibacteraeota bacterium]|nr:long-chain fatty acid--CoA ligase [Candidatus Dormibacteraeota bacterium]
MTAQREVVMDGLMMDYPLTLTHLFQHGVRYFPGQEIVTQEASGDRHRYSFAEFGLRTERLARALRRLGVEEGDRVGTFAFNTHRHLECYFAIPGQGAVLHTLNVRLFADDLAFVINDAADQVVFCERSVLPLLRKVADRIPQVRLVVLMGDGEADLQGLPETIDYEELLAASEPGIDWPQLDERQAAAMSYTSGTTDRPKGVVYSHRSSYLHSVAAATAGWIGLSFDDSLLPVVPMFHVNAWGLAHAAIGFGTKLVLPGRFLDPVSLLAQLESESVTVAAGVPTIWGALLSHLDQHPTPLPHLRMIICGGSAAPPSLIAGFDRHGLNVVHAWGMTETSPVGTVNLVKPHLRGGSESELLAIRAKQGLPALGVDLRVVDLDSGLECPPDGQTPGEIQVRGAWVARAYYHDPGDHDQRFTGDGWFRTGDVATVDAEGYVQIVDRTKDLVKSGGEWISSVTLEGELMAHPKVKEAAVVGFAHPRWSERPVGFVVARPENQEPLTKAELLDFLRPRVASFWLPDEIIFLEEVPKTSVGKFDKKLLRQRYASLELD